MPHTVSYCTTGDYRTISAKALPCCNLQGGLWVDFKAVEQVIIEFDLTQQ